MPRLFWKIFFLFWVVNACVFLFGIFITNLKHGDNESQYPIENMALLAIDAFERNQLHDFYQANNDGESVQHFLLSANNEILAADTISAADVPQVTAYPYDRRTRSGLHTTIVQGIELDSTAGDSYRFIAQYDPHKLHRRNHRFVFPLFWCTIAMTSLLVAAYITRPLRKLQTVVQRFACGEHNARVPCVVSSRRDVVGEVGREFNVMAERLYRQLQSQRQLLRDISHELRTPLARMQVAVAIAEEKSTDSSDSFARIHTEIERLDALIGQVLTLSRIESGAGELEKQPLSVNRLLEQIAADAEYEFSEHEKTVQLKLSEEIQLNADKHQLQSAIENVIRNAMRYTPSNGVVDVLAENVMEATVNNALVSWVRLTIRDFGPGVADDSLSKLFNAFYKEDDARGAGGHGVGLAISRSIVAAHGGDIAAINNPQGGLQVEITLPA